MLVFRCSDHALTRSVQRGFPDADIRLVGAGWDELATYRGTAGAYLLHLDARGSAAWSESVAQIRSLRSAAPSAAIVVIAERSADTARDLVPVGIDALIWTGEVEKQLIQVVDAARGSTIPLRIAADALANRALPVLLGRAVDLLFRSPAPVRTVTELARIVGCHRSSLAIAWGRVSSDGASLAWLLDANVCLRAGLAKRPSRSWSKTCEMLGLTPRQVGKASARVLKRRLSMIDREAIANLAEQISARIRARGTDAR